MVGKEKVLRSHYFSLEEFTYHYKNYSRDSRDFTPPRAGSIGDTISRNIALCKMGYLLVYIFF